MTATASVICYVANDYSDFEDIVEPATEPEEAYPETVHGIYIVNAATGDVIVKSGLQDGDEFNAITTTAIMPSS